MASNAEVVQMLNRINEITYEMGRSDCCQHQCLFNPAWMIRISNMKRLENIKKTGQTQAWVCKTNKQIQYSMQMAWLYFQAHFNGRAGRINSSFHFLGFIDWGTASLTLPGKLRPMSWSFRLFIRSRSRLVANLSDKNTAKAVLDALPLLDWPGNIFTLNLVRYIYACYRNTNGS